MGYHAIPARHFYSCEWCGNTADAVKAWKRDYWGAESAYWEHPAGWYHVYDQGLLCPRCIKRHDAAIEKAKAEAKSRKGNKVKP